jgi:UDPglucose 6-dehydrogenase
MCADKRIGTAFLYPGLGYGGSCFPKDTLACIMMGETKGVNVSVSKAVHDTNQKQRDRFFDKIVQHFGGKTGIGGGPAGLQGKTLAFWGIAFKPKTDDIREAPSLTLIRKALGYGALVRAFDPVANENARRELGPGPVILDDMYEAAKNADALVVCTDWDEFKSPDWGQLTKILRGKVIFDGRNLYRRSHMAEKGFHYYSVGRAPAKPA